jgi:hypothetical protein
MLSLLQAAQIVGDCIRVAVGFSGPIMPDDKLSDVGIVDDDARDALNDEIVTNKTKGVRSAGHSLGPSDLSFTIDNMVFELRDEVFEKAVPNSAFMSALAAGSLPIKGSKKGVVGVKKGGSKSGKPGKKSGKVAKGGSSKGATEKGEST